MERDLEVNGVRLHCVVEGEGPLILLLHGFPETSRAWRKQMPALAERFRVVAPDLRGFGASDKPKGIAAYRTSIIADDVVALIHAFDAERAHIVGHDWGGGVAWTVAILHPEAVDRLVVLNCPHPVIMQRALRSSWSQIRKSWYIFAFQIPWLPEWSFRRNGAMALKGALRRSAKTRETFTDADLEAYARAFGAPGAATSAANYYRRLGHVCRAERSRRRRSSSGPRTTSRSASSSRTGWTSSSNAHRASNTSPIRVIG